MPRKCYRGPVCRVTRLTMLWKVIAWEFSIAKEHWNILTYYSLFSFTLTLLMMEVNSSHNYKVLGNFLVNRLNFRSLQKVNNSKDHFKSRVKTRVKTTGNEFQGELIVTVTSGSQSKSI